MALITSGLWSKVAAVRADMDDAKGSMIGSHGYCSQELVNLMLTGKATSNVFAGSQVTAYFLALVTAVP